MFQIFALGGVAAEQAVFTKQPEITSLTDRLFFGLRDLIVIGKSGFIFNRQQLIQFLIRKTDDIKVESQFLDFGQLEFEQIFIPTGVLGDLVVGDHQSLALRFSKMAQHDYRHLFQPQLLRGHQAAVSGNDDIVIANQDRIDETELGNRTGDLRHLPIIVGARITRIGDQPLERPVLHRFDRGRLHSITLRTECEPRTCEPVFRVCR